MLTWIKSRERTPQDVAQLFKAAGAGLKLATTHQPLVFLLARTEMRFSGSEWTRKSKQANSGR